MRILLILVTLFSFTAAPFAAGAPLNDGKTKKITIKTSAVCGMCKTTIEKALNAVEGVKDADLDVVTKKVKIKYDESKVDAATLRQAISAAGYDADEIPARKKAFDALDDCCKSAKACQAKATGAVETEGAAKAACCEKDKKEACCDKEAGKACKKDTEG